MKKKWLLQAALQNNKNKDLKKKLQQAGNDGGH